MTHENLNQTEKDLLGYLACINISLIDADYENRNNIMSSTWHEIINAKILDFKKQLKTIEACCVMAGIKPNNINFVLKNKFYIGLTNHNKLSYKEIFN